MSLRSKDNTIFDNCCAIAYGNLKKKTKEKKPAGSPQN